MPRRQRRRADDGTFACESLIDRFWSQVDDSVTAGCWPWLGVRHYKGYGEIMLRSKRKEKAARLAWILANASDIPAGYVVRHSCDNPPCCNPAHLSLGTVTENNRDRVARRRHPHYAQTHCKRGHEFTSENTRIGVKGERVCRACMRLWYHEHKKRHRTSDTPEAA